ncbi:HlyD family secretion protein [Niveispirillum irakense]|uniref:HlyD family secretion protein n=1 Tax=Niveispirillum irakense TaxID=34011 RepID=UPI0003FF41F2|nr:HlyD family secretion protein [Niveispirillum irakense]
MSVEPTRPVQTDPAPSSSPAAAHDHGPGALGARPRSALVGGLRRLAVPLFAVASVLALVLVATDRWEGWVGASDIQVTDNATIRADISRLGARVSGAVRHVAVADYQKVKAGDLLLEIDPAEYQAAVDQAAASVASARAALDNLANQMDQQRAAIAQADAKRLAAQAGNRQTRLEEERQADLLKRGLAGTRQKLEQASADHDKASAEGQAATAALGAAHSQLDVLKGQEAQLAASLRAAEAALEAARLRLSYTRITAPVDGVVGERLVHEGDYVAVGASLIAVVPLPQVHVTANYKETQLTRVVPGQKVDIRVDMFPGQEIHGHVARMAPASGSTFALLPPDNATGNFTKVVQRIPVRIELEPGQPLLDRLRPGMSVETRIHTDQAGS